MRGAILPLPVCLLGMQRDNFSLLSPVTKILELYIEFFGYEGQIRNFIWNKFYDWRSSYFYVTVTAYAFVKYK
jgi:hypothetical protein